MQFSEFSWAELVGVSLDYLLSKINFEEAKIQWRPPQYSSILEIAPDVSIWHGFEICAIAALASALRSAPPGKSLRQWLAEVLQHMPMDVASKGKKESALTTLRRTRCTGLLILDCNTVAEILDAWAAQRHKDRHIETAARVRESISTTRLDTKLLSIRTEGTKPFVFNNSEYKFPYLQRLLLECLRRRRPVPWQRAVDLLWGREPTGGDLDARLRNLQFKTNARLLEWKIPLRISRPSSGYLLLELLDF